MREFFRGWKRKIGVLTLLLACALTTGWMRSFYVCDDIRIPGRDPAFHLFFTLPNWFGWVLVENPDGGISPQNRSVRTSSIVRARHHSHRPYHFIYGNVGPDSEWARAMEACPHLYVSFSWIAIPLTMLSGWLLLSKRPPGLQASRTSLAA